MLYRVSAIIFIAILLFAGIASAAAGDPAHAVRFVDWDGTLLGQTEVADGGDAVPPADPVRPGYAFSGWDKNYTNVREDLEIKAQYNIATYTITYDLGGGANNPKNPASYTILDTPVSFYPPTKAGYEFVGWTTGTSTPTIITIQKGYTGNITLTAVWVTNTQGTKSIVDGDYTVMAGRTANATGGKYFIIVKDKNGILVDAQANLDGGKANETFTLVGAGYEISISVKGNMITADSTMVILKYSVTYIGGAQGAFSPITYTGLLLNGATPQPDASQIVGNAGWVFDKWLTQAGGPFSALVKGRATYVAQWRSAADFSYTVEYRRDSIKGIKLFDDKIVNDGVTFDAVITENARPINGYNPDFAQKSVTIGMGDNRIIFVYTPRSDLSYTVEYRANNEMGTKLRTDKTENNVTFGTICTEYAETIDGYAPDESQKTVTIGTGVNRIVFVYSEDSSLRYTVEYRLEVPAGAKIRADKVVPGVALSSVHTESAPEIEGYTPPARLQESITIGPGTNIIVFVYKARTDLSYTVEYREESVKGKILRPSKRVDNAVYNSIYFETAETIPGYYPDLSQKSVTIGLADNFIIFLYIARSDLRYTVEYRDGSTTGAKIRLDKVQNNVTYGRIYTEYAASVSGYTARDNEKSVTIDKISDNKIIFVYDKNATTPSYKVEYRKDNELGDKLLPDKIVNNVTLGETYTENAEDKEGYTVDEPQKSVFITNATNLIVFIYKAVVSSAEYTVTYDPGNGRGGPVDPKKYKVNDAVPILSGTPTLAGYTFDGWQLGHVVYKTGTTFTMPANNVKLDAVWKINTYTISYRMNSGVNHKDNPTSYTIINTPVTLKNPTRTGYIFTGWSDGGVIPKDSTGNVTFTANWAPVVTTPGTTTPGGSTGGPSGPGTTTPDETAGANPGTTQKVDDPNVPGGASTSTQGIKPTSSPKPASAPKLPFITDHLAYIIGYPEGDIRPNNNITRAEVATVFFRVLNDETRAFYWTQTNPFSDISPDSWYNNSISVMREMGILSGYLDGTFQPENPITRAELAAISAKFAQMMGKNAESGTAFNDVNGHWAEEYVAFVSAIGWINGYPDGLYRPDQYVTRAEFMSIVNRMLKRVPELPSDLLADEMAKWTDNMDTDAWYYIAVQEATNTHTYMIKADRIVPGLQFEYERWAEIKPNRDWALFERQLIDSMTN